MIKMSISRRADLQRDNKGCQKRKNQYLSQCSGEMTNDDPRGSKKIKAVRPAYPGMDTEW